MSSMVGHRETKLIISTGIRYLPKYVSPGEPPSTVPAPQGAAPTAVDATAYVYAVYEDGNMETDTCLISAGTLHSF